MRNLALPVGLFAICGAFAVACGSSFTGTDQPTGDGGADDASSAQDGSGGDPLTNGEGGAQKDAGPGGGGPQPGAEGGAPLDGIFVSANSGHDDTGDGTMANPLKTITKGIARGKSANKSVIVCNQTYTGETLTLLDGISVYGNYDCSNPKAWTLAATNALLQAPQSPAVTASAITKGTTFGHIDIQAPAALAPTMSSIGVLVTDVTGLELSNLKITTGDALPGKDGADPTPLANDANIDPSGGTGGVNTCGGSAKYSGGTGGVGAKYLETCTNISPKPTKHVITDNSKPGLAGSVGTAADGTSAASGAYAAPTGYVTGDGKLGTDGSGGVGGKGAVGTDHDSIDDSGNIGTAMNPKYICVCSNTFPGSCSVNAGGTGQTQSLTSGLGGTAGGCPGLAGGAGQGGGASIGVVSLGAYVTLTTVSIQTGKGGDGGKGTYGTAPTAGGSNATAGTASGVSGSGAGGPSVCVVFNTAPVFSKGTEGAYATGTGGAGVNEIAAGDGRKVPASGAGAATFKLMVP